MFYAIRHFTRYRYSQPVWESSMEVRMHPASSSTQRCFTFQLSVSPKTRIFSYIGHLGNTVHHFDIAERHRQLTIVADALVDIDAAPALPDALPVHAWSDLDQVVDANDYWDMLMPSAFARSSPELEAFAREIGVHERAEDPLSLLRIMTARIYDSFAYTRESTSVDSPIEHALSSRRGVCQDFAHIMTALVRRLRIPCRYVSGYLHQDAEHHNRSSDAASHAWIEALLPNLGWVGFDPTNNVMVEDRHIRVAIGRDYADVPPSMGVMKGSAQTELQVRVRVTRSGAVLPPDQEFAADEEWSRFLEQHQQDHLHMQHQQQQQ